MKFVSLIPAKIAVTGAVVGAGLFWPVGIMGGIVPLALATGALLGAIVGSGICYKVLSMATVVGLVSAMFFGAWLAPGCDDRSGYMAIPGFVFGWLSYRVFDRLTGS
jgi:hypothetical protein